MLESRDLILYFELHNCSGWNTSNDLLGYVLQAITAGDLIPLEIRMIRLEERKLARPVIRDFEAWFAENYQVKKEWDQQEFRKFHAEEYLGMTLRATLEAEWRTSAPYFGAIEANFEGLRFGEVYNYFEFFCGLTGRSIAFPNRASQLNRVDEIGQLFVTIAKRIIPGLAPAYGVITGNPSLSMYGRSILNEELDAIHWSNYFGPEYLAKYDERILQGAPGYEQKKLGNGVWYQIAEKFRGSREAALSENIAAHFRKTGLKKVSNVHYVGEELEQLAG
jgi:hypothetical protein